MKETSKKNKRNKGQKGEKKYERRKEYMKSNAEH
jgi:hypothetical protein